MDIIRTETDNKIEDNGLLLGNIKNYNSTNIRNLRLNRLFSEFENVFDSPYKGHISQEIKKIKGDLDALYMKGQLEKLNEIKHDLLEEMFLSFSKIHGATFGTLDRKLSIIEESKKLDDIFRINRLKQSHIRALISHIDNYRFIAIITPITASKPIQNSDQTIVVEDIVKNEKALSELYDILIKADLIDKDTKIFIDKTQGGKGYFYSTLLKFREKGYFKREPSIREYLDICINSFSIKISDGTARNKKSLPQSVIDIPAFVV